MKTMKLNNEDFTKISNSLIDMINKKYPEEDSLVNIISLIAIDVCNCFFQEYEKMKNE